MFITMHNSVKIILLLFCSYWPKRLQLALQVLVRCSKIKARKFCIWQYSLINWYWYIPYIYIVHWAVKIVFLSLFLGKTHPLHAIAVPDLQLLLGPLEATVLLVIGRGLKVDVNIIGGLRGWRYGYKFKHKWRVNRAANWQPGRETDRLADAGRRKYAERQTDRQLDTERESWK